MGQGVEGGRFGIIGKGNTVAGMQQAVSVAAGGLMVGMALLSWRIDALTQIVPGLQRVTGVVHRCYGQFFGQHTYSAALSMGMLNGLLPCGMVYAALAGAVSTTNGWEGGLFMAAFGSGTLPLLLLVTLLGKSAGSAIRQKIGFLQPLLLAVAGFLMIQRGLHLDLSLFDGAVPKATLDCH